MAKEVKEDVFKGVDFGSLIETDTNPFEVQAPREEDMLQHAAPAKAEKETKKVENTKKPEKDVEVEEEEELEVDELEEDEKNTLSHNDSQSAADSSVALQVARFQNERGLLSTYDEEELIKVIEEDGDEAALEYLYTKEIENRVEDIKKTYDADLQEYISLKDAGVDSLKAKDLVTLKSEFESITPEQLEEDEDGEIRRKVLIQDLKNNSKLPHDEIEELVDNLIATGKDVEKSKKALVNVKKFNDEQIKLEKQAKLNEAKLREDKRKEADTKLKESIYGSKQILGQTINKVTQQKLEKFMFEPIGQTKEGSPIYGIDAWFQKNPTQARVNLAYAIMTGLLDGKMDVVKDKVKSDTLKELREKIKPKGSGLDGISEGMKESTTLASLKKSFNI